MSKLTELIAAAKSGLTPWQALPEARLYAIAAAMGQGEIDELIARLEHLATEFEAVPAWDGDTQDDISAAAATFYGLLSRLAPELRAYAERGLSSTLPRVRIWVTLGLEAHGAAALPALEAALAIEGDDIARHFISGVVERVKATV